ncbi:MAG: right-handed parallel beta-helix repeat-containing protein, partial [Victivallales bacterium]|nr:right-handed parallel beta-helix repeat-containing protein [Victivallales bacterium]
MKHITCIMLAAFSCATTIAFAQAPAPDKVAQVAKGELKEARASWWGFDKDDSTVFLEKAINSKVPRLIIDKMPSPWITARELKLPSNIEIVFEEGTVLEAKRWCFKGLADSLVTISQVSNDTLRGLGKGATWLMHKADYHTDAYKKAEWRTTLNLLSCSNIRVENLTFKDSGGDGIYFGVSKVGVFPTDIVIRNVICDGHNRQGISVIAGVNCLVENCKLINTWGTPPAAGIDFEPNHKGEAIKGFVLRNVESYNNKGGGYMFYLLNMDISSGPLEITLENCTSRNEGTSPFSFYTNNGPGFDRPGLVHVKNCTFEDCPAGVSVVGTSAKGFKTLFENVTIRNIGTNNPRAVP